MNIYDIKKMQINLGLLQLELFEAIGNQMDKEMELYSLYGYASKQAKQANVELNEMQNHYEVLQSQRYQLNLAEKYISGKHVIDNLITYNINKK